MQSYASVPVLECIHEQVWNILSIKVRGFKKVFIYTVSTTFTFLLIPNAWMNDVEKDFCLLCMYGRVRLKIDLCHILLFNIELGAVSCQSLQNMHGGLSVEKRWECCWKKKISAIAEYCVYGQIDGLYWLHVLFTHSHNGLVLIKKIIKVINVAFSFWT